jgi:hypothetical protein
VPGAPGVPGSPFGPCTFQLIGVSYFEQATPGATIRIVPTLFHWHAKIVVVAVPVWVNA